MLLCKKLIRFFLLFVAVYVSRNDLVIKQVFATNSSDQPGQPKTGPRSSRVNETRKRLPLLKTTSSIKRKESLEKQPIKKMIVHPDPATPTGSVSTKIDMQLHNGNSVSVTHKFGSEKELHFFQNEMNNSIDNKHSYRHTETGLNENSTVSAQLKSPNGTISEVRELRNDSKFQNIHNRTKSNGEINSNPIYGTFNDPGKAQRNLQRMQEFHTTGKSVKDGLNSSATTGGVNHKNPFQVDKKTVNQEVRDSQGKVISPEIIAKSQDKEHGGELRKELLNHVYEQAKVTQPRLTKLTRDVAKDVGGQPVFADGNVDNVQPGSADC